MNKFLSIITICILITSGCTDRHIVLDPDKATDLDDGKWKILKEPQNKGEIVK